MAEDLRRLPGPYEILDLEDGGVARLKIVSYERGTMIIHPKWVGAPSELEIPALRAHLAPGVKPYPPMYWDITSKTLTAQLLPLLAAAGFEDYEYVITKHGIAPKARFTLERTPL